MKVKYILSTSLCLLAVFGLLMVSGCKNYKQKKTLQKREANASPLTGGWKLMGYMNPSESQLRPLPEDQGRGIVINFKDDGKAGKFTGHTKANEILGSYTLEEPQKITIVNFTGTKVGGEPKWGTKFWRGLKSIHTWQIQDQGKTQQLILIYDEANAKMILESIPEPEEK